jgi:hypothetical protein
MRHSLRRTQLFLAGTLLLATPLVARFRTKQIGYLTEHARELVGKSFWVDGCVNGAQGNLFQLADGSGAISVLTSGEAPQAGVCMELNGVVRFQDTAGVKQFVLEERSRKIR